MKKLLLIVASLALGGLVWAASNSACIFNLIPPTSAVQVCQDGSGQMNLQDATAGPLTLSSIGGWSTYISTSAGNVTVSSTLTASKGITTSTLSVTGAAGASVTYGVTVGSVTTPLVTVSTAVVTSSMTVQGASTFGTVTQSSTTLQGYAILWPQTLAQLQAMTPANLWELFACSNCVSTPVCISTGTSAAYQFAGVSVSTSATTGLGACK